ncbi:phosphotriesterase-related protein [Novosphingobium sp. PhB165]|uniref:phosphotriesterase family protein n=1 Tax=Novosphingobium sp. PhB165 TaxID=2485105 RepID=UPI0010453321|nr:phosphotriesterase [Novosphingobium sp. PhB165]TCM22112.1 phosphotriesterase-related protein [Novosphingobium sp. PhB165]
MPTIQTANGTISEKDLGRVLIHEHVFLMDMEYTFNYRPDFLSPKTIDDAVSRLDDLKAAGFDTIIDLTVLGLGRHMPSIAKVAVRTGINIIVSTGAYTFDAVPAPFQYWGPGLLHDTGVEPMVGHFVADIVEGIADTGIRAGMLKCAIDAPGLTGGVERIMRAVGRTHVLTGAPVTVHTSAKHETGLIAQKVLSEEGVDLENVVIGHCGDTTDIDYLMRIADRGSMLGMDRFGVEFEISMEQRVATIAEMVSRGYASQMVLSHDCCCWSDFFPEVDDYNQAMPRHHYLHIHDDVLPALRNAGVSQLDIERMLIANPRRVLVKERVPH